MNRTLWILQIILGVYFIAIGVTHFIVPEGLPEVMSWMYDLSDTVHVIAGLAEILGGLGLILPAVTGIRPELVPLAASGLVLVMAGAVVFHIGRGEYANLLTNLVLIAPLAFVAYGRWQLHPHTPREVSA